MRIIKSFFIAFSMYSKIPMPQFQWKDEDMRYALCFFPWVGAVIGALWYLWKWFCDRFAVGTLCYAVVGTAIPLLVTGGFHVDGFLDTCDALAFLPAKRPEAGDLEGLSYRGICSDHACTVRTDFPGRILGDHDTVHDYCDGSRMLPVQSIKRYRSGEFPFGKAGRDTVSVCG